MVEDRVSGIRYRSAPRAVAEFSELREAEFRLVDTKVIRGSGTRVDLDLSEGSEHNFYAGVEGAVDGVFIATHRAVRLGDKVEVTIHLPESMMPVIGVGEVRWLREYNDDSDAPPGMGVQIVELEGYEVEAVKRFVSKRDPLLYDD